MSKNAMLVERGKRLHVQRGAFYQKNKKVIVSDYRYFLSRQNIKGAAENKEKMRIFNHGLLRLECLKELIPTF
jgi:hypothetical protein